MEDNPADSSKAYPVADVELSSIILNVVNQANHYEQLKKGINESVKALNKGVAEIVILAADATPIEIVLHVPQLCENKNVFYAFVPFKAALGRAAGVARDVVAVAITERENSALQPQIVELTSRIEQIII